MIVCAISKHSTHTPHFRFCERVEFLDQILQRTKNPKLVSSKYNGVLQLPMNDKLTLNANVCEQKAKYGMKKKVRVSEPRNSIHIFAIRNMRKPVCLHCEQNLLKNSMY